nr:DUF3667 domain-containing protein [Parvularcula dongshanensis]
MGGATAEEALSATKLHARLPARCYACGAPVQGPWCYACGQKNDDCRRSIFRLVGEFIRDVTSLDGRFLHTVRAVLTRPGRHLRDYGDGKRSPYTSPVRFFLVVSFAFFTTLALTDRQILVVQPEVTMNEAGQARITGLGAGFFTQPKEVRYSRAEREAIRASINDGSMAGLIGDEAAVEQAVETRVEERLAGVQARLDAAGVPVDLEAEDEAAAAEGVDTAPQPVPLPPDPPEDEPANAETDSVAPEDLSVTINGQPLDKDRFVDALFLTSENPRLFNAALDDWIPRLMILMVPLMALTGAIFVRGKDALLYDHLLLSLNTHALAFLIVVVALWFGSLVPGAVFGWIFGIGVPLYYAIAMRGAFGRRKRKVIVATFFVFSVYMLVFSIALSIAATRSFYSLMS